MKIGYRRVSSESQNLDRQLVDQLDVERMFEDKLSGATRDRPALNAMIAFARAGDAVVLHSLDRLGRDLRDLLEIVETLNRKGVAVEFLAERLKFSVDDNDPFAKLQLHMLAAFAQWERAVSKIRQSEGIARAKEKNPEKYRGRPASIDASKITLMKAQGIGASEIARRMGIGRASVYRVISETADRRAE